MRAFLFANATRVRPRCTNDVIEERLFEQRRDLVTTLNLVFFDTTSIYFEGAGGETLGQQGHGKDHRPDLKQRVMGMLLDGVVQVCIAADRGMISQDTLAELERRNGLYMLGA